MQDRKYKILSTRELDPAIVDNAALQNCVIDTVDFIKTVPVTDEEIKSEVRNISVLDSSVIFTSANAVEAVAEFISPEIPVWKIYCTAPQTEKLIRHKWPVSSIIATAESAATLATKIIRDHPVSGLYFFCGDKRVDDLPRELISNGIRLKEIIVYRTLSTPIKVAEDYDGIMFFSPAAVKSFFSVNKLSDSTKLFAIGSSTAAEIKQFTAKTVITSDRPGKERLVETMTTEFTQLISINERIKK